MTGVAAAVVGPADQPPSSSPSSSSPCSPASGRYSAGSNQHRRPAHNKHTEINTDNHRRRIKIEEKAKVVAADCGGRNSFNSLSNERFGTRMI